MQWLIVWNPPINAQVLRRCFNLDPAQFLVIHFKSAKFNAARGNLPRSFPFFHLSSRRPSAAIRFGAQTRIVVASQHRDNFRDIDK
jgi:hypothetical protein